MFTIAISLALRNLRSWKRTQRKILFVFPERFSDQFISQIYQFKFKLNNPQYKRKKSEVSFYSLIFNKLHSVIIYALHDNPMFKPERI